MGTKKRVITALVLMGSLMLASVSLPARERKGARVVVEKNDGANVSGELLMVKRDCLVVDDRAGGVIVSLGDVHRVRILRKSKAGTGFLTGFLGSTVIGYVMFGTGPVWEGSWFAICLSAFYLGLPSGVLGALIGLGISKDLILDMNGMELEKLLIKLNRYARVPDVSLVSGH